MDEGPPVRSSRTRMMEVHRKKKKKKKKALPGTRSHWQFGSYPQSEDELDSYVLTSLTGTLRMRDRARYGTEMNDCHL